MRADGRRVSRLTRSRDDDGQPAWSPDGRRIAFVSRRDRNDEIYVMNAGGSHAVRLTSTPREDEFLPRWSPSGEQLVFWSTAPGRADRIWTIGVDGTGRRLVATGSHADWLR
jgi:Tol biopolymer transport system component